MPSECDNYRLVTITLVWSSLLPFDFIADCVYTYDRVLNDRNYNDSTIYIWFYFIFTLVFTYLFLRFTECLEVKYCTGITSRWFDVYSLFYRFFEEEIQCTTIYIYSLIDEEKKNVMTWESS